RAAQGRHLGRGRNSRRVSRSLIRSAENSASCRKRICPLTSRIIHLPFASRSGHHTRYAPLPVRGSVHLSRQFLEKLTESAIIKVALREDLSEVATGCGGLRLHPAVGEGGRWRGTGSSNPSPSSRQSVSLPQPLSKVENPAFRAGLRGWLGDRVGRDAGMFCYRSDGRQCLCRAEFQYRSEADVVAR